MRFVLRKIARPLGVLFILLLSIFVGGLIGLAITGSNDRNYFVFSPDDMIENYTVIQLVEKYKPILYQEDHIIPPPEKIYYEVTKFGDSIILAYRIYWRDEYHPNALIDVIYRIFRIAYYGDSADIETVEFVLDSDTLQIKKVCFEILRPGSSEKLPEHQPISLVFEDNGISIVYDDTNVPLSFDPFEKTHLILQVSTWNHLFNLTSTPRGKRYDLTLVFMTNEDFRHYKMVRRSAFYLKQDEQVALTLIVVVGVVVTLFGVLYILIFRRDLIENYVSRMFHLRK